MIRKTGMFPHGLFNVNVAWFVLNCAYDYQGMCEVYIMLEIETKETYIITISNSKKFIIVKAEEDKN